MATIITKAWGAISIGVIAVLATVLFFPASLLAKAVDDPVDNRGWTCDYRGDGFGFTYTCTNPSDSTETWKRDCLLLGAEGINMGKECTDTLYKNGAVVTEVAYDDTNGLEYRDQEADYDADGNPTGGVSETVSNPLSMIAGAIGDILLGAIAGIAFVVMYLAAMILSLSSIAFNFSVNILVLEFAKHFGNSEGLLAGWRILRDIGNILLLFGFVSIGVQTILNINHFSVGKALPRLVIFAVFLNFSLFTAEILIDGSNAVSTLLYKQSYGQECEGLDSTGCIYSKGIGSAILEQAGMGSIVDAGGQFADIFSGDNLLRIFAFLFLALFMTVTAFTLLAGALLLVSRAVVLVFLMITSPIGFAGMAIPGLNKVADDWWHALINNVLFAPAYLVLIFVSLKVMQSVPTLLGSKGHPDLIQAVASVKPEEIGTAIVPFLLMIGFMILAVVAAKQFSVVGASFAVNSASALAFGTFARGANLVVGGGAYGLRRLQQKTGLGGKAGEVLVNRALRPLENSNLDLRKVPGLTSALGKAGVKEGLKEAEHAKFGDMKHIVQQAASRDESRALNRQYKGEVALQTLEKEAHNEDHDSSKEMSKESKQVLASMGEKDLTALHAVKEASPSLIQRLSPDQFEALVKSDKLDDGEKERIKKARFERLVTAIEKMQPGASADTISKSKAEIRRWTNKDLEQLAKMNAGAFKELVTKTTADGENLYTNDQYEAMIKSNALSNPQRQEAKENSVSGRLASNIDHPDYATDPKYAAEVRKLAELLRPQQKAALSGNVLRNQDVVLSLSRNDLGAIMAKGQLKDADVDAIINTIDDPAVAQPNKASIDRYLQVNNAARSYWRP